MLDNDDIAKLSWQLFVRTGGINYYLLHNQLAKDNRKNYKNKK